MTEEAKKGEKVPQRKRTEHTYVVLQGEIKSLAEVEDSTDALAWIKKNGKSGETYQRACLIGEPVRVAVETIEKRRIVGL
jgi:hypothetical protein